MRTVSGHCLFQGREDASCDVMAVLLQLVMSAVTGVLTVCEVFCNLFSQQTLPYVDKIKCKNCDLLPRAIFRASCSYFEHLVHIFLMYKIIQTSIGRVFLDGHC
jgi:hypothetical protein